MEPDRVLYFTSENPTERKKLQRRRESGELHPLRQGIYVSTGVPPEEAVRRHWLELIDYLTDSEGHLSHRSVFSPQPGSEVWFVSIPEQGSGGRNKIIELPGVRLIILAGMPKPDTQKLEYMGQIGLISALETAFLEVTEDRRGPYREAIVDNEELELLLFKHHDRIQDDRLKKLAEENNREPDRILSILKSIDRGQTETLDSEKVASLVSGGDYDPERLEMFTSLSEHLAGKNDREISRRPWSTEASDQWDRYCFIGSYFSNYVEGTRFPPQTAMDKIQQGVEIGAPPDERTLVGTYRTYQRLNGLSVPAEFSEFQEILKEFHRSLAEGNESLRPGEYKIEPNSAGSYTFVKPERVIETLRAGWELLDDIRSPFFRALYLGFIVSEVHPFKDGNGRLTRLIMDLWLIRHGFSGFVITPRSRDFYLNTLYMMSMEQDAVKYEKHFVRLYEKYCDLPVRSNEEMMNFCEKENLDEEADSFLNFLDDADAGP